jgi:hypothetical protein
MSNNRALHWVLKIGNLSKGLDEEIVHALHDMNPACHILSEGYVAAQTGTACSEPDPCPGPTL